MKAKKKQNKEESKLPVIDAAHLGLLVLEGLLQVGIQVLTTRLLGLVLDGVFLREGSLASTLHATETALSHRAIDAGSEIEAA